MRPSVPEETSNRGGAWATGRQPLGWPRLRRSPGLVLILVRPLGHALFRLFCNAWRLAAVLLAMRRVCRTAGPRRRPGRAGRWVQSGVPGRRWRWCWCP